MPISGSMQQEKVMQIAKALDVSRANLKHRTDGSIASKIEMALRLNSFLKKLGM